jgi:hypothetical protein
MSVLFDDATNEGLYVNQSPVQPLDFPDSGTPVTMACFFRCDDATPSWQSLVWVGDKDSDKKYMYLVLFGSGVGQKLQFYHRGYFGADPPSAVDAAAVSTTQWSENTWHHACGVLSAYDSRTVYLDGSSEHTNTGNINHPGTYDRTAVGLNPRTPAYTHFYSGVLCDVAFWDIDLTKDEVGRLAAGYSPLFVRPENLVAYYPLIRDDGSNNWLDIVGDFELDINYNSPEVANHYRMMYPASNVPFQYGKIPTRLFASINAISSMSTKMRIGGVAVGLEHNIKDEFKFPDIDKLPVELATYFADYRQLLEHVYIGNLYISGHLHIGGQLLSGDAVANAFIERCE